MLTHLDIAAQLAANAPLISGLLLPQPADVYTWRPEAGKWCLLEITCHLYDEEREDFRARLQHVLTKPEAPMSSIDPVGWVASRRYMAQDYHAMIVAWQQERQASVQWLRSLDKPDFTQSYMHPTLGLMSGWTFLNNWLAHDYLHIRQITKNLYLYLQANASTSLAYAGDW